MIYMDNAATTMRKPKEVAEAVMHAMNSMGNAGRGANEASLIAILSDSVELLVNTICFGFSASKKSASNSLVS